jgi:peptidoglycan hydrolase-like protein with peptidoglycan-binding domain
MDDHRKRLLSPARLLAFALSPTLCGPALAESAPGWDPLVPGIQVAQASTRVLDIQRALNRLGYDAGPADGRMGARTRGAIEAYQRDQGLLISGEPSAALLRHMRERAGPAPAAPEADFATETETVAQIQAELRMRGYRIPRVSGRMDAETRRAIEEYQQGQGVRVTGEPSRALLDALRAASAEAVPEQGLTREQRAAAQRALNARGYDAGPPDGVLNPRSRVAIRTFQADQRLSPTGELTPRTLELLDIEAAPSEPPAAEDRPYRARVRDNFADGDFTRDPAWRIASGRFEVRDGGLYSEIGPPSQRPEDVGLQLLGDLLQQQLGVTLPGQERAAVAHLPVGIGQAFRITAELSGSAEGQGHLDLGPYQGDALNHGYRLSYRPNQPRPLQLLLVDEGGSSTVASASLRLDKGGPHRLVWQREADGRMTVTRDGEVLMDVVDRQLSEEDFAGFSLINAGGQWTLHEVIVEERGE